jgi:transcriptional regulator with XRE-family HTH domain
MPSAQTTPTYARMEIIVETLLSWRGRTRAELADHLGVHVSAISKAYKGKRRWTMDEVEMMAEFFDVPVTSFFDDPESLVKSRCSSWTDQLELFANEHALTHV